MNLYIFHIIAKKPICPSCLQLANIFVQLRPLSTLSSAQNTNYSAQQSQPKAWETRLVDLGEINNAANNWKLLPSSYVPHEKPEDKDTNQGGGHIQR